MIAALLLDSIAYEVDAKKIRVSPNTWISIAAYTQSMENVTIEVATGHVRCGGRSVGVSRRERDLALAVASREQPVTMAQLAEMLYPDRDIAEAANLIKVYIFRLRKRVGPDFILRRERGYVVGPHVALDLSVAKVLLDRLVTPGTALPAAEREQAVALARGLRAESVARLTDYDWLTVVAQCAHRVGRELALLIGRDALAQRVPDEAVRVARELTFEDACDEEAWELLIQAYLMRGERLAAMQGFRFYERVLSKELDLTPSPYLRGLLGA